MVAATSGGRAVGVTDLGLRKHRRGAGRAYAQGTCLLLDCYRCLSSSGIRAEKRHKRERDHGRYPLVLVCVYTPDMEFFF